MNLTLSPNTTLNEVQKEFNALFPNLKLRFFAMQHPDGSSSPNEEISTDMLLEEARKVHGNGNVSFDPKQTVAKLEGDFRIHFGLNAQVFRQSGKAWLETTTTDSWTLEKQNEYGAESMQNVNDSDKPSDYNLIDED